MPWNGGMGGKRPRRRRDVLVLPDGAGSPGMARRCSGSEPVSESPVTAKPGSNLADMGPVRSARGGGDVGVLGSEAV